MTKALLLAGLLLLGTGDHPNHVRVRASLDPKDAHTVVVMVRIEPDARHRVLDVVLNGEVYASASSRLLNGADERLQHRFTFRRVPHDVYEVVVGVDGGEIARDGVVVPF
jgi:hypothetical protein